MIYEKNFHSMSNIYNTYMERRCAVEKMLVLIEIEVFLVFLLLLGTYKLMNSRTFQLFWGLTQQIETNQKVVALTFDDGPTDNTNQILQLFEESNTKTTFFLIGADIEKFPEETRRIAEYGHQFGNHTYSHNRVIFKSPHLLQNGNRCSTTQWEKTDRSYLHTILFDFSISSTLINFKTTKKRMNPNTPAVI